MINKTIKTKEEIKKHQIEIGAVADGIVGFETIQKSIERFKEKMTREEAINNLESLYNEVYNEDFDGYNYAKAIDIAIEVLSDDAVPKLRQTDTLIIADALRYLALDTERHLSDRTRADALREQFLKYGASMCKGGDNE